MKREKLYHAITEIREDIVERAEQVDLKDGGSLEDVAERGYGRDLENPADTIHRKSLATLSKNKSSARNHSTQKKKWMTAVAAVLVVVLVGSVWLLPGGGSSVVSAYALAEAAYPTMAPYPNESEYIGANGIFDDEGFSEVYDAWRESLMAQRREEGYADGLEDFFQVSSRQFLTGAGDENLVYSPLNVYMALGMLAELTDGESRQQILDLLGSESIKALRAQASDVWNASYCQDGAVTSVLASSLWLNEGVAFNQSTLDTLAENYYASSYQGDMQSEEFEKELQTWLNQQTGGLLEEQAGQIEFPPESLLTLATTVYFQCKWGNEFVERETQPGTFHGASEDVTVDFMNQRDMGTYYWAEKFGAVARRLESDGHMWFILPDEGVSVEDLLADDQVLNLVFQHEEWVDQKFLTINQSIPKFDVVSQLDLKAGLQELGVRDVFDPVSSDFTPMTLEREDIFLAKAQHDSRVAIDEEGVTAAAYTVMMTAGAGMPPEDEMDFIVDRPFLFVITSRDNLPLFVGVVNQP